jgi:hypothetical protein
MYYTWNNGSDYQSRFASATGWYIVTVTDQNNCTASAKVFLTDTTIYSHCSVTTPGPVCPLDISLSFTECNPIQFTNTSLQGGYSFWSFGNGQYGWNNPQWFSYHAAGTYTVSLWNSDFSCAVYMDTTIVFENLIEVDFSVVPACSGSGTLFTNLTTSTQPLQSLEWDFGDGNTSSDANPLYTYVEPGLYDVQLIVFDGLCYDSTSQEISIPGAEAGFSVQNTCLNQPVVFIDSSTGSSVMESQVS